MKWINDGNYYVSQPLVMHHIGHFAESVNQLLLKLRYPSFYPPLATLYIPQFGNNEYEWSKIYLHALLGLFPDRYKPILKLHNSIPISTLTCFRTAVFFDVLILFRLFWIDVHIIVDFHMFQAFLHRI